MKLDFSKPKQFVIDMEEMIDDVLSDVPEDMSKEHITSHAMHLWDMRIIEYMRTGQAQRIIDEMPEFTEQAIAESDGGGLTWLLSTLTVPSYPAILHGYGTIIGTGNAIVEWPCYAHEEV